MGAPEMKQKRARGAAALPRAAPGSVSAGARGRGGREGGESAGCAAPRAAEDAGDVGRALTHAS